MLVAVLYAAVASVWSAQIAVMPTPSEPTEEEIREACRLIREGWDEREHYKRAGLPPREWFPPGAERVIKTERTIREA